MESPAARLIASIVLLGSFYWVLVLPRGSAGEHAAPTAAASLDALLKTSRQHFVEKQYGEALAPTLALVEKYPTQQVYLERLALIYQGLGRRADEAKTWERFMARSLRPADACPTVADAYAAAGDAAAALASYEKCFQLDPTNPEAASWLERGRPLP